MKVMLFLFLPLFLLGQIKSPSAINVTWQGDPSTTMTIFWHSSVKKNPSYLHYRKQGDKEWKTRIATSSHLNTLSSHHLFLSELIPNTTYEFAINEDLTLHTFKTLSKNVDEPLRFIVGGDSCQSFRLFKRTTKSAAAFLPDFIILGGDIAYTLKAYTLFNGKHWEEMRWHHFFEKWANLTSRNHHHVPILIAPGNHDVKGAKLKQPSLNTLFYEFYPYKDADRTYFHLSINDRLAFFLLDTGHGHPIEGAQTKWLKEKLKSEEKVPHKIAVYHKAAYPSYYDYEKKSSKKLRSHWTPLFDQFSLQVAFENDNHTYKRTHPIKNEKIDPSGTLYLGDGSWGVWRRTPKTASNLWYLAKTARKTHFYVVDYTNQGLHIRSFDTRGHLIEDVLNPNN